MTAVFFGAPWGAPALDYAEPTDTPVGRPCLVCRESIADGDLGWLRTALLDAGVATIEPVHAECDLLGVAGHTFGVCSCTGYDTTSREAARELWQRAMIDRQRPGGAY